MRKQQRCRVGRLNVAAHIGNVESHAQHASALRGLLRHVPSSFRSSSLAQCVTVHDEQASATCNCASRGLSCTPLTQRRRGTDAWQLVPGLGSKPTDTFITEKNTYDAFQNTQLESLLRQWGVDTVLVGGVVTNMCSETTARCAGGLSPGTRALSPRCCLHAIVVHRAASPDSDTLGCYLHGKCAVQLPAPRESLCTRRSAFTKNFNVMMLSDGNEGWDGSLHKASLKAFEAAFGKVVSCDDVKRMFAEHEQ